MAIHRINDTHWSFRGCKKLNNVTVIEPNTLDLQKNELLNLSHLSSQFFGQSVNAA